VRGHLCRRADCRYLLWLIASLVSLAGGCGPPDGGDNGNDTNLPPALRLWEYDRRVTTIDGPPVVLTFRAEDPEGEALTFEFGCEGGTLEPLGSSNEDEGVWASTARWSPTGLEIGYSYGLWCKVSDTGGNTRQGDTQAIVVTTGHVIMGDPVLESQSRQLSPAELDFGSTETELTTELTIAPLEQGGAEYLPWQVSRQPEWVTEVSPDTGDGTEAIAVRISRDGLAPGRYTGDTLFEFVTSDQVLTAYLSVTADVSGGSGALLAVSPTSLDFGTSDTSAAFQIANEGGGSLAWECAPSDPWIAVADESGTGDAAVTVTVDRAGLSEGAQTGSVEVTSNGGNSTVSIGLEVAGAGTPTATLEAAPTSGTAPLSVTLTGSASDTDGSIVLYTLDFGDGSAAWSDSAAPAGIGHTYAAAGSFRAQLSALDDDSLSGTASQTIVVQTTPSGTPTVTLEASRTSGAAPFYVRFTGSATDADGTVVSYSLDFGDGTAIWSGVDPPSGIAHEYAAAGTYQATLTADDDDGKQGVASMGITVSAGGPPLADTAWPMFGHDLQHTRRSPYVGAQTPTLQWAFETGGGVDSSPAIAADGTIYVGSDDGKLYSISPDGTGSWEFAAGSAVRSSPAIAADGTIYVGSDDHRLYAINPDGTKLWEFTTYSAVGSSPAIGADGTIYVGSPDNKLSAINPDGTGLWEFATGNSIGSSPAIGADGTIYVGSNDNRLYAIDPDGAKRWEFAAEDDVRSPAIGADGTIYVGSWDANVYAINPDGTKQWEFATGGNVTSSPAIGANGTIYIGSWDQNVYAINPDGTKRWEFATGDAVESSPAIGADGTIYVASGSFANKLYAINPNGTKLWEFAPGGNVSSSPAIGADGTIYVRSADYLGYRFELYAIGEGRGSPGVVIHGVEGVRRRW